MEFFEKLDSRVKKISSRLCVGIDPHSTEFGPGNFSASSVLDFCVKIVDETAPFAAAFKINSAFFEALGSEGWRNLEILTQKIRDLEIPIILDCKRGDIGSTAEAYATAFFEKLVFSDSVTLSPFLGRDSIAPFLKFPGRGVFILCKTSNPGSCDFQTLTLQNGEPFFLEIPKVFCTPGNEGKIGLVVGATDPASLKMVSEIFPGFWILAPGLGAQGGDLHAAVAGAGPHALFPISRGIYKNGNFRENAEKFRDALNSV